MHASRIFASYKKEKGKVNRVSQSLVEAKRKVLHEN